MESNHKRRGSSFTKAKLVMSFYRPAPKPTTSLFQYNTSTVKLSAPPSTTSVGYLIDQELLVPSSKKVSFVKTDGGAGGGGSSGGAGGVRETKTYVDYSTYGGGAAVDESVDIKAASYISYVQERFRLERMASERRNYKDIAC